jgi:hypothetical protein
MDTSRSCERQRGWPRLLGLVTGLLVPLAGLTASAARAGESDLPDAKPVPAVQVLPLPLDQASFQHEGRELTRHYFGPGLKRPFWYPMAGPEGRSLSRIGHPHDPVGHRHHYSVWIAHDNVGGASFWADSGPGQIVCQRVEEYADGQREASMLSVNAWKAGEGKVVMFDRRRATVRPLGTDQWLMLVDLQLEAPPSAPVALGQTPFGMMAVRMAKTIGVADGGGRILNSEGQVNEAEVFRKPARWVDYSGPVTNRSTGGITLMDHPGNPGHPAPFHVRTDGWMGACLTLGAPMVIQPGKPLLVRYALWVHAGVPKREEIDKQWKQFAGSPPARMEKEK